MMSWRQKQLQTLKVLMEKHTNGDDLKILLKKYPKTITALVILNLIPVLGVIFFGWSGLVVDLLIFPLFWLEILIIALVNMFYLDRSEESEPPVSGSKDAKDTPTLRPIPRAPGHEVRKYSKSTAALFIANLVPLLGVIFFDWSIGNVVISYWTEIVIIGYFTLQRMKKSEMSEHPDPKTIKSLEGIKSNSKPATACKTKEELIKFFISHYGIIALGVGFLTLGIFSPLMDMKINYLGVLIGTIGFFVSHHISHKTDFIETKEYERVSAQQLFVQPYPQLGVFVFALSMGAFPLAIFDTPFFVLILYIIFKIILDIKLHVKERREFGALT